MQAQGNYRGVTIIKQLFIKAQFFISVCQFYLVSLLFPFFSLSKSANVTLIFSLSLILCLYMYFLIFYFSTILFYTLFFHIMSNANIFIFISISISFSTILRFTYVIYIKFCLSLYVAQNIYPHTLTYPILQDKVVCTNW